MEERIFYRQKSLGHADSINMKLTDKFDRGIDYLRLSVTDRCNLRCAYCMPERGMKFAHRDQLLSYEELLTLVDIMGDLGISKLRLTGGEPFVRSNLMSFLTELRKRDFLKKISITSNLTLIEPHLEQLLQLGIKDVNVSLDAVDRQKFFEITKRDEYEEVISALHKMIEKGFNLKLNCVVMKGTNEDQILPMLDLAKEYPLSIRFLEEMPFNGLGEAKAEVLSYNQILELIGQHHNYSSLIDEASSTSQNYGVDGFAGTFGVIPSFSRTFCGDCNRLRLASTGEVRTCLYGSDQLNLKTLLRDGHSEDEIKRQLVNAVANKPKDGFEAESENQESYLSMTKLGG